MRCNRRWCALGCYRGNCRAGAALPNSRRRGRRHFSNAAEFRRTGILRRCGLAAVHASFAGRTHSSATEIYRKSQIVVRRSLSKLNFIREVEMTEHKRRQEPTEDIRISFNEEAFNNAKIKVIGVGGGGGNAVNRMISARLEGVEFVVANTDQQALQLSQAPVKIQLGSKLTNGLGAGANPDVGRKAALEDADKIIEALEGADMVFVTAGLGGGTGTGAAPIIASLASEMGALTVAVVTKPFAFEGKRRLMQASNGLSELIDSVDTTIVIPNEKLLAVAENAGFFESFKVADDI